MNEQNIIGLIGLCCLGLVIIGAATWGTTKFKRVLSNWIHIISIIIGKI